jgi:NitT/TauT family transport system substrate-binding protein
MKTLTFLKNQDQAGDLRIVGLSLSMLASVFIFAGCGQKDSETTESGLIPITLQTDWYAQPEHGGFYQAVAEGYYEEVGLDVTINQGGTGIIAPQLIATRKVDFAINRADDIIIHKSNGVPIIIVAALMQHDPQALLLHEESEIDSFEDLDGRTVMTTPGGALVRYIEKTYDITINVTPMDYGMSRFLANKDFVQQCFITNEPYYIKKAGANPKTLLLSDSGFDPYRVIFTNPNFAKSEPEVVKAFVAASIRGWKSYMAGPREKANATISKLNPKMTPEFIEYSINSMLENQLVSGYGPIDKTGLIEPSRMQAQIDTLFDIGLVKEPIKAEEIAPTIYLPKYLQDML